MKHLKSYVCILSMLLLITGMSITSCTEDFGPEIDRLKEDVSSLKTSVDKLKDAYEGGKIVSGVEPITTGVGGWKITFSDNSAITLQNGINGKDGVDGITPYVKIDKNCNWTVSYDNGKTYTPITDANGNTISAKGIDGANGVSVEVQVNSEGKYEIITYVEDKSNPITILPTPYSANPDNQITSIVEDSERGMVSITMSSGKQYNFGQALNYPTSIVLLKEEFLISEEGGTAEIEFFVNPSNAKITKEDIVINQLETGMLKSYAESYANPSPNYEIVSLENSVNEKGEQLQGRYKLTIKHIGEFGFYEEYCTLVISTKDAQDNKIEITSEKFLLISNLYSLTVQVILPDLFNWSDVTDVSVKAVNSLGVFELSEISEGVYKTVEISEGEYEVTVTMSINEGEICGSSIVYVDNAQTAIIETEYIPSTPQLIIKEFYTAMCKTPANKNYFMDQFYEIYNNSAFTAYLDDCVLARTYGQANTKIDNLWAENDELNKEVAVTSYVAGWVGDGTGKKYPIKPGQSVVVAFQAQDHVNIGDEPNPNTVDLSKADYEISIIDYKPAYVDNPDVPNMTIVAKPSNQTLTFGMVPAFGSGLIFAKVPGVVDYVADEANWKLVPNSTDTNPYLMIKHADILDAINIVCVTETQRTIALPSQVDAGMLYTSAMYNGMGFTRKVAKIVGNRVVYQDTNNSSVDFEPEAKPTPGY